MVAGQRVRDMECLIARSTLRRLNALGRRRGSIFGGDPFPGKCDISFFTAPHCVVRLVRSAMVQRKVDRERVKETRMRRFSGAMLTGFATVTLVGGSIKYRVAILAEENCRCCLRTRQRKSHPTSYQAHAFFRAWAGQLCMAMSVRPTRIRFCCLKAARTEVCLTVMQIRITSAS